MTLWLADFGTLWPLPRRKGFGAGLAAVDGKQLLWVRQNVDYTVSGLAKLRCWRRRGTCAGSGGGRLRAGLHAGCAQLPHSSCCLQADQPLLLCSKMPARLRLLSPRARASFSLPSLLPLAAARSCGRSPVPPDRAPQAPWCGRPPHAAFRCGAADGGGGVFSSARGL